MDREPCPAGQTEVRGTLHPDLPEAGLPGHRTSSFKAGAVTDKLSPVSHPR